MMDPNLTFDWDQWDAVFGQQLPMADELVELDPVTGGLGLGLNDLGIELFSTANNNNMGFGGGGNGMVTTPGASSDVWRDFETWQY
jgi:hypothetical protein